MSKVIVGLALLALCCSNVLAMTNLESLEKLVQQQNYQQAWQQAQKIAQDNEGDPRFDYLYGLSALETGNYDQAVFALDRVVVRQPFAVRPRLELARAYMKVKNSRAALREFQEALKLNPPPKVRESVNRFITALTKTDKALSKHVFKGRASALVGYDSNVNFGADSPTLDTPVFGTVILNPSSVKQSSPFSLILQGQFNYRYIASKQLTWFFDAGVGQKHYKDADEFDIGQISLAGGALFTSGQQQYRVQAKNQALWLNDDDYKRVYIIEAGVAHKFTAAGTLSAALALDSSQYTGQAIRDGNSITLSGGYAFDINNTRHRIQGSLTKETADQSAGEHHASNITSLGYTLSHTWGNGHSSSVSADYQHIQHQGNDPVYAIKRRDKRLGLHFGHAMRLGKKTSILFNAGLVNNHSNLELYDTDKSYVQTGFNYHF